MGPAQCRQWRWLAGGEAPPASADAPPPSPPDEDPEAIGAAGLIRGPEPTTASTTVSGPFEVDVVASGLRDGPEYGSQTLHVAVGAEPPFASVVVVPASSRQSRPKAENTRAGSPLEGEVALDRFGAMGWSMGGGGTLIAASANPDLRVAVGLAAWSPGVAFGNNQVPTLLLAGSADGLAGGQSQGFFQSMPESTPKMLFAVAGGSHNVANDPASADGEIGRYAPSVAQSFP